MCIIYMGFYIYGNSANDNYVLLQNESRSVDINVRNSDGFTPLLLVARDITLFEKLGEKAIKGYKPVDTAQELLQGRA